MRSFLLALVLSFSAPALAAPPSIRVPVMPATAAPGAKARAVATDAYGKAAKAYYKGRFGAAQTHAERAWAAVPNASTALVLATIHGQRKRHCQALDFGLLALELRPSREEEKTVAATVLEHGPRCESGYGWLRVELSPKETTATLSGTPVPLSRTVAVPVGRHELVMEREGYEGERMPVRVAAGGGSTIQLVLRKRTPHVRPEPKAPAPVSPEPAAVEVVAVRPDLAPDRTAQWVLIGSGAAAVAGGVALFVVALDAAGDAAALSEAGAGGLDDPTRQARYESASQKTSDYQTAAWVVGGAGLVAATIGIVLAATTGSGESGRDVGLAPAVLPHGGGVQLGLTF